MIAMSDLAVTGRPKTSPVWDYFSYDESAKKSKCEVITNVVTKTKCGKTFSGKFSTNLKLHLKSSHREAYDEVIKKEKQNKEKENEKKSCTRANAACNFSMESNQPQITTFLKRPKLYNNEDPKCKAITKKLSIFLAASSAPISLVEDPTFSSLITELDSRYSIPSRYMMSKKIDEVLIDLKGNILSHMLQARKVNFCTDIWSKKGMTASFIGVTAHFFASHKRHNVTLAVKRMPSPHTGEEVLKIVLQIFKDWNIPDHKIGSIITDNGSNMVKAFKILQLQQKENMQNEGDDEEDFELCDTDNVDVLDTGSLDDSLPDQEKTIEESHQQDMYEQEREFDENEFEHEIAFVGYRRLSCFAHSLQLVVSKFDECSVFRHTIKKAKNIVSKFNKSTKATEKLIANAGLKLLGDCPTRWSSTYLLINRFLTVKASVIQVLDEHSWDGLQNSEWRVLENIQELLQPFAEYTTLCSGEEYTTISSVVPIVVELQYHLEEMSTKPGMATISKRLNNELKSRFDKYVNPSAAGFDVYYLVATFLDPKYTLILNDQQTTVVKAHLIVALKTEISEFTDTTLESGSTETVSVVANSDEQPPLKKFRHLSSIISQRLREAHQVDKGIAATTAESEIERFYELRFNIPTPSKKDALTFWLELETTLPNLFRLAVDLMVVPASSAPIECTFSIAGYCCIGRRNRLTNTNLEREVLIKANDQYI